MSMVNIYEAKAKLSELVEAAGRGERVVICNRNVPVAELRAADTARTEPRDLAPMFPDWSIPSAFFEPLDEEEIRLWQGETEAVRPGMQVAEEPVAYGRGRKPSRRRKRV